MLFIILFSLCYSVLHCKIILLTVFEFSDSLAMSLERFAILLEPSAKPLERLANSLEHSAILLECLAMPLESSAMLLECCAMLLERSANYLEYFKSDCYN